MKAFWITAACLGCFLIGCNIGEERMRRRVLSVFSNTAKSVADNLDRVMTPEYDFQVPRQVDRDEPPEPTLSRGEVQRILREKDQEILARSKKTNQPSKRSHVGTN
jgi:hypothetical protein